MIYYYIAVFIILTMQSVSLRSDDLKTSVSASFWQNMFLLSLEKKISTEYSIGASLGHFGTVNRFDADFRIGSGYLDYNLRNRQEDYHCFLPFVRIYPFGSGLYASLYAGLLQSERKISGSAELMVSADRTRLTVSSSEVKESYSAEGFSFGYRFVFQSGFFISGEAGILLKQLQRSSRRNRTVSDSQEINLSILLNGYTYPESPARSFERILLLSAGLEF
ncbi:MAG TPA: hypothetical protein PL163_09070 [Leptospiraceae bacterium]|nr:hypothetical protein [Leptospiraceae bacterium]